MNNMPGSTASNINMPGFTGESALPRERGGGAGSNFWCDESAGTCSCLGGSLSEDCWLMQQYCIQPTSMQCLPSL
jgi:hypothetical protein